MCLLSSEGFVYLLLWELTACTNAHRHLHRSSRKYQQDRQGLRLSLQEILIPPVGRQRYRLTPCMPQHSEFVLWYFEVRVNYIFFSQNQDIFIPRYFWALWITSGWKVAREIRSGLTTILRTSRMKERFFCRSACGLPILQAMISLNGSLVPFFSSLCSSMLFETIGPRTA